MSPTVTFEARERWSRAASVGRYGIGLYVDGIDPREHRARDEPAEDADAIRDGARRRDEVNGDPSILPDAHVWRVAREKLPRARVGSRVIRDAHERLGDLRVVHREHERHRARAVAADRRDAKLGELSDSGACPCL